MPTPEEKAVDERFAAVLARESDADALARARAEGRRLDDGELDRLVAQLEGASGGE